MMPVGIMDSELGFSQTSAVFAQPKPFRTISNLFGYNSLIEREIPSGSRAFPDEEGTESPSCILDAIEVFRRRSGLCLWVVGPFVPASVTNLCRDG